MNAVFGNVVLVVVFRIVDDCNVVVEQPISDTLFLEDCIRCAEKVCLSLWRLLPDAGVKRFVIALVGGLALWPGLGVSASSGKFTRLLLFAPFTIASCIGITPIG